MKKLKATLTVTLLFLGAVGLSVNAQQKKKSIADILGEVLQNKSEHNNVSELESGCRKDYETFQAAIHSGPSGILNWDDGRLVKGLENATKCSVEGPDAETREIGVRIGYMVGILHATKIGLAAQKR